MKLIAKKVVSAYVEMDEMKGQIRGILQSDTSKFKEVLANVNDLMEVVNAVLE